MKDTAKKPFLIVLIATAFLTLLATALRVTLLLTAFDTSVGHFADTPLSSIVFPLLFIAALILVISFSFIERDQLDEKGIIPFIPTVFAAAFTVIAFAVWVVTMLPLVFSARGIIMLFGMLMLLFAIGLIAYFTCTALSMSDRSIRAMLCLCATLFCVFYVLFAYFDTAFTLNSPIKIFDQITLLVFAVFFLAECRLHFGTINYAFYLPITLFATMLGTVNALSALLYAAIRHTALTENYMHDFIILALSLYTLSRLVALLPQKATEARETEYPQALAPQAPATPAASNEALPLGDPDQEAFDFDAPEADDAEENAIDPADED